MKKLMITATVLAVANVYAGWGDFGKAAAKEATAATIRGVAGALSADKKSDGTNSEKDRAKQERDANVDAEKAERDKKMELAKKGEEKSAPAPAASSDISTIEDDAQFFAAFKGAINDADSAKKKSLFERACQMKNEDLLVEFLTAHPDQAKGVAVNRYYNLKNSKLAELILDNLTGLSLEGSSGWVSVPGLDKVVFHAAKALDANARAKYLKIADENLAAAKQDEDLLVVERYYVGMPVIDYVMRSFEEKHGWTKEAGAVVDRLDHYADMKTEISLDDWKKEWKIKYLVFTSKERSKIFKTKGTMDGFVEFLKKYVDKSATINDITVEGGWWIYLDDPHELKVSLNDNNGALNIYRQR